VPYRAHLSGRRSWRPRRYLGQESVRSAAVPAAEKLSIWRLPTRANHYLLALETFALKLDAFEARLKLRRGQMRKPATALNLAAGAAAVADVPQAESDRIRSMNSAQSRQPARAGGIRLTACFDGLTPPTADRRLADRPITDLMSNPVRLHGDEPEPTTSRPWPL
jgi:hypothetical protein